MTKRAISTTLFLLFATVITFAQTGTIRGTIKDAKTNEDLIGATVKIDGTSLGSVTDINGFFSIAKVPAGKAKVVITYVSYKDKVLSEVAVVADNITEINTALEEEGALLAEVKVTASRLTNTEVSIISEIKAAQMVVNGISAQQIAKSLDRDAAQVVKRVPGITIVGDRFINIRGLNSRYNNVMLHNAFTPSMETDVKSFSFDIIPSSQIDRMLIFKSPSAELPGEFAGGIVKIFTKNIPDKNSLVIDYSTSYRSNTTFADFYQPNQGKNYWTGFNNGYYDLPKFFPASINDISNNPAALETAGRSLKNEWIANKGNATPDQRIGITGNYRFNVGNVRIGNVTAVNYSDTRTNFVVDRNDFNANINNTQSPIYNFNDQQYSRNIRVGIMHNWAFRLNDNNSIEWKNLFNQLSNSNYTHRTGRAIEANYDPDNHSFNQVYRGIYTGQLTGKHTLTKGKTTIDWVIGYNNSYRDQPDYRRYRSDVDPNSGTKSVYIPVGTAQAFFLGRWFSKMKEDGYTGAVNLTQKITLSKEKETEMELKAGVFYEKKDRSFDGRNLGYVRGGNFNGELFTAPINVIFNNINNTNGIRIDEQTNPNDSYTAGNKLLAYYAMANIPLSKKLNIIAGARVEDNTQSLQSAFIGGAKVSVKNPVLSVLPSANLSYNFSEKMLIRAAYGQTINRPEFRELAPFSFYDFDFNVVYEGYTGLKVATVNNFDARWELYPTPAEVVSVALFHKDFRNPIEIEVEQGSGSLGAKTFIYNNAKSARSTGVELEIKKGLASIAGGSKFIERVSVLFNATLLVSKVKLRDGSVGQSDNRPLQGQSPYIVNTGINYNNQERDFQVNILYNVIGKRIFAVGFQGYPDLYEMPRNVLDLTFSKGIGKQFAIKGGINDIFNQAALILQDGNQDGKFDRNKDEIIQQYKPGRLVSLGVTYTLSGK
ncbi:TonB-dependent receptor [Emticicia fontis]